jgi:hypothetical protein
LRLDPSFSNLVSRVAPSLSFRLNTFFRLGKEQIGNHQTYDSVAM